MDRCVYAKHNIKQNAEINTYNTIKKGVNKMTNRMTYEEYNIINNLKATEWRMVLAELDDEQVADYWLIKMIEDDHQAALNA